MEYLQLNDDVLSLMKMDIDTLQSKIKSNPMWQSDTAALQYFTVLQVLCGDALQVNHKLHQLGVTENECRNVRRKVNDIIQKIDAQRRTTTKLTDVEQYRRLEQVYMQQKPGSMERVLAGILSIGIFDREGRLTMIPRIDNYLSEVRIAQTNRDIDSDKDKGNWYLPSSGRMVVREFKTDKQYNFDYRLPKKLVNDISLYIKKQKPKKWLFPNSKGTPKRNLSELSGEIFGKKIGQTQAYRSLVDNYHKQHGVKDEEVIAKAMGHGVNTGAIVYSDRDGSS